MQSDQRVEGGAEEVGLQGEAIAVDQFVPFHRGAAEEDAAEKDSDGEPDGAEAAPGAMQSGDSEVDRDCLLYTSRCV